MAIPDRDARKGASAGDPEALPPRDRDQHAVSAARAQDKADQAEASANRPIGTDGSARGEALPARDRMQGTPVSSASGESAVGSPASSAESANDRRRRIAERAYYKAERRGFAPGGDQGDWLDAEDEIGRSGDEGSDK